MDKISIVTVNWWGNDFAKLLANKAIEKSDGEFNIIIVDNSNSLDHERDFNSDERIKIINVGQNLGHGLAMNRGITSVESLESKYILALDIDSHILIDNWNSKLINAYNNSKDSKTADMKMENKLRLIGASGGLLKPMRPAVMFFERSFFIQNNMSFEAKNLDGVKFDVGIHFYFKTLSLGYSVKFLEWKKTEFKDTMGEEYTLNGERAFFHHWWATRWYNKDGNIVHKEIDGIKREYFENKKNIFFKQV